LKEEAKEIIEPLDNLISFTYIGGVIKKADNLTL